MSMDHSPLPGLLYVPLSQGFVPDHELNDWYNNEHTPTRMRYEFFLSGRRYKYMPDLGVAHGNSKHPDVQPQWLALYEISDMHKLTKPPYSELLSDPARSARDRAMAERISASRKYFDLTACYSVPDYNAPEVRLMQTSGDTSKIYSGVTIIVHIRLKASSISAEEEWNRWYAEDHAPALRNIPGWQRTRCYKSSVLERSKNELDADEEVEYLTLNEFADCKYIGGSEHQIAIRTEKNTNIVKEKRRDYWALKFIMGKGPRDLESLYGLKVRPEQFFNPNELLKTQTSNWPIIESFIAVPGFGPVDYRLEGVKNDTSPVIVLFTIGGAEWSVWDDLVQDLQQATERIRILRLRLSVIADIAHNALDLDKALSDSTDAVTTALDLLLIPHSAIVLGAAIAQTAGIRTKSDLQYSNIGKDCKSIARWGALLLGCRGEILDAILKLRSKLRDMGSVPKWIDTLSTSLNASIGV